MTHSFEGLTTEILIEILLKKVRHQKCDPLLGVGVGMVGVGGVVGVGGGHRVGRVGVGLG